MTGRASGLVALEKICQYVDSKIKWLSGYSYEVFIGIKLELLLLIFARVYMSIV